MDTKRRTLLHTAVGAALAAAAGSKAQAQEARPARTYPRGEPGQFDWLSGEWRIANRMKANGAWIEFPGEATVFPILNGVGSVEELRIPARDFSGMGLRMLDMESRVWSDHWVNGKSGVVTTPGMMGGFVDGVGTFTTDDMDGETPVQYRGVWDNITPTSCRWRQGGTRDGGRTWDETWFMEWTRVGPSPR